MRRRRRQIAHQVRYGRAISGHDRSHTHFMCCRNADRDGRDVLAYRGWLRARLNEDVVPTDRDAAPDAAGQRSGRAAARSDR